MPGLDLGMIEDVVEDIEQRGTGRLHLCDVSALRGVVTDLAGEFGIADDGVHRCADLMAHVRQKGRLRLVGLFGFFQRHLDERLFFQRLAEVVTLQGFHSRQVGDLRLDLARHLAEGIVQRPDFTAGAGVQTDIVVAGLDAAAGIGHRLERPRQRTRQRSQHQREQAQGESADQRDLVDDLLAGRQERLARQTEIHLAQALSAHCDVGGKSLRGGFRPRLRRLSRRRLTRNRVTAGILNPQMRQFPISTQFGQDRGDRRVVALRHRHRERSHQQGLELAGARLQLRLQIPIDQRRRAQTDERQRQHLESEAQ